MLVGLSGGADSVCLLAVLRQLSERGWNLNLSAVHIHHGIRGDEADRDAAFAEELCTKWGISCEVIHYEVEKYAKEHGLSCEEAGRMLRYETFERMAEKDTAQTGSSERTGHDGKVCRQKNATGYQVKIAVAHHGDDDAETILQNLFRGSGLKGLGGIQPVRGRIIRPLLCVRRREIEEYLAGEHLPYCQDSTNAECDYTRNKLRNQILPLIVSEVNEGAIEHIIKAGELASQADACLERMAEKYLHSHMRIEQQEAAEVQSGNQAGKEPWQQTGQKPEDSVYTPYTRTGISAASFLEQDPLIQTYIIRSLIQRMSKSAKDITSRHIHMVQELASNSVGRTADLPYALRARRDYEYLWIEAAHQEKTVDNQEQIGLPELQMDIISHEKGMEIPKNQYTKWFDYDKIKKTLSVRTRQSGDYITLAGGGKKTIKSYMIDEKIPAAERGDIPLLVEENHVLWIIGYRISEYYKVTEQTKKILQVHVDGGYDNGR